MQVQNQGFAFFSHFDDKEIHLTALPLLKQISVASYLEDLLVMSVFLRMHFNMLDMTGRYFKDLLFE